ncbi:MAG: hypothetical protein ACXQS7_05790 [Candidatus Syntropharchaeia archaeon]
MNEEEKKKYDLLIPMGFPLEIIGEALEKFNVKLVERPPGIALRGEKEEVERAHLFMYKKLKETVERLEGKTKP